MAIAFVKNLGQSAVANQQAATIQLSGISTAQFNTVTVRCHSTAGNNVTSIQDSQGNKYYAAQPSIANAATAEIWYGFMTNGLVAGNTITVFFETPQAGTAATADEWSGIIGAGPVDVTAEKASATTSVTVGPTATASATGSLVLTAAGGSGTGTWTYPGGAYTNLAVPGSTVAYQGAYQIAGGVGGFSATWALTGATSMEAVIAVFQAAPSTGFKLFPLPYIVEILVAGVWQDITNYVYTRDGISITGGRSDATVTNSDPATCTMTLDNRDGRFTPNYTGGAYYPNLVRNIQLRVSIANATSSSGNVYSGVRFWGKIADFPPQSDISGTDVFTQITATGPLREIRAGGGKGSALTRYYATLTGAYAPVAYWPCEEDADTDTIGAGIAGGSNMNITAGTPIWKAISDFDGSIPVPIVNYSTWDGVTGSLGSSGNDVFSIPGVYQWTATTSTVDARAWGGGGGAENGWRGCAGGGGEFARESALAVTPGTNYTVYVGGGGYGGAGGTFGNHNGGPGGRSLVAGDVVTLVANGGLFGTQDNGGNGGSGSANTQHANGGTGGSNPSDFNGGAGGGSSAGFSGSAPIAGNNGSNPTGNSGANGGAAVTGGGAGGKGGFGSNGGNAQNGFAGGAPGGGGGGGGDSTGGEGNYAGGAGGAGQVQFIYTPASGPTTIVVRFIMMVPKHGGNPGKVLLRFFTGSTVLSHLDVSYALGGKLRLQGFNGSNVQQFDSTAQSWAVDGQPIMVSVELVQSGANVNWAFKAVTPGSTSLLGGGASGSLTATLGNCSEVTVSPNADISSTAIGHISLQYALIPLTTVSAHLVAHSTEVTVDRFIRLANEQAIDNAVQYSETNDHFGFENGVQSWVGTNGTLSSSPTTIVGQWPTDGTNSLLLTANGSGQPTANSSTTIGAGLLPVNGGDIVSVAADIMTPTALAHMFLGILWFTAGGVACTHATDVTADTVMVPNTATHFQIRAVAPTGTGNIAAGSNGYFAIIFGDHNTDANNTLMYLDNVRIAPQMGHQTWKEYHAFLEEIEDLDQGILKEAKKLHGLGFKTRIALTNQSPAVTLDYTQSEVTPPLSPVVDSQNVKNDITVKRHHGTSVRVIQTVGSMSVFEPPAGTGRFKKILRVAANEDKQLAALGTWLLNLGTVTDERYPTVTVDLTRCQAKGGGLPPLMSAVAGVEIGDMIQINNLPFWMPSATAKQLVIGYTEVININQWTITWNCTPESPWEITASALRRW